MKNQYIERVLVFQYIEILIIRRLRSKHKW